MREIPNVNVYVDLRDKQGLSDYRVSKLTGIAQQTLSSWQKNDYYPKRDKIGKIAEFFSVPIEVFYKDGSPNKDMIFEVAAGNGRINDGYCACDMHQADGSEYSRIIIRGDSMLPSLHDGDILKVHHVTDDIRPSDFAVVKINGDEATVKHIQFESDGIWLKAENKDVFEDKFYSMQECVTLPVQVIGKAIEIVSRKL